MDGSGAIHENSYLGSLNSGPGATQGGIVIHTCHQMLHGKNNKTHTPDDLWLVLCE